MHKHCETYVHLQTCWSNTNKKIHCDCKQISIFSGPLWWPIIAAIQITLTAVVRLICACIFELKCQYDQDGTHIQEAINFDISIDYYCDTIIITKIISETASSLIVLVMYIYSVPVNNSNDRVTTIKKGAYLLHVYCFPYFHVCMQWSINAC